MFLYTILILHVCTLKLFILIFVGIGVGAFAEKIEEMAVQNLQRETIITDSKFD